MQRNARRTLAPFNLTFFRILRALSLLLLLGGQASQALAQQQCPTLTVTCPRNAIGGTITFTASPAIGGLTYEWAVDAGTIASGQGTPVITVIDVLGSVTAVVQTTGCSNPASCTSSVRPLSVPRNFDSFVFVANDDIKARLDNFAIQLQNDPGARAYIIVTGDERIRENKARFAANYLTTARGIDEQRLEVVATPGTMKKSANDLRFDLWIVPVGAEPPKVEPGIKPPPSPTPAPPPSRPRSRGGRLQRP